MESFDKVFMRTSVRHSPLLYCTKLTISYTNGPFLRGKKLRLKFLYRKRTFAGTMMSLELPKFTILLFQCITRHRSANVAIRIPFGGKKKNLNQDK